MNDSVSVEQAINRFWMVVMVPLVFGTVGFFVLGLLIGSHFSPTVFWVIGGFVCSILFAWLYWAGSLFRWFVWAFTYADNVYELKKAIDTAHIVYWGDWEEKLANVNPERYNFIQQRINHPFVFNDDLNVPGETIIRYSLMVALRIIFLGLFFLLLGLTTHFRNSKYAGLLISFVGLVLVAWQIILVLKRDPKIVLSNDGIWTYSSGFSEWADISGEDIVMETGGKNRSYFLVYKTGNDEVRLKVNYLGISTTRLLHLLLVYRLRSKLAKRAG